AGALLRPEPTTRGWGRGLPDLSAVASTRSDHHGTWAAQVVAETTRDGTRSCVVHSDASPAGDLPGRYAGPDQGAARARLSDRPHGPWLAPGSPRPLRGRNHPE